VPETVTTPEQLTLDVAALAGAKGAGAPGARGWSKTNAENKYEAGGEGTTRPPVYVYRFGCFYSQLVDNILVPNLIFSTLHR